MHKQTITYSIVAISISLILSACTSAVSQSDPARSTLTPASQSPSSQSSAPIIPSPTIEPDDSGSEFTDGLNRQVILPGPAKKIISLAPSNTEILFALGAGDQVIGRDAFSDYPEAAQSLADVGGGWGELNNELIVSLQPDLVLAAQINTAEQVKTLEDLGLTVYYLANPTDMEGLYANLQEVARLTGRETEAATLVENLKSRIAAVEGKISTATERPLVFYELDSTDVNAPYTSGPGTFIDLLISMAGGTNLGHSLTGEWVQVSVEELISQNPDFILLGDYVWGGVKPEDVIARPGWDAIAAVKNSQVYPFDDNLVSRPGPRLVDGLEELARLLHPELFK
jgi:iron complex transport system substrate-binding protein